MWEKVARCIGSKTSINFLNVKDWGEEILTLDRKWAKILVNCLTDMASFDTHCTRTKSNLTLTVAIATWTRIQLFRSYVTVHILCHCSYPISLFISYVTLHGKKHCHLGDHFLGEAEIAAEHAPKILSIRGRFLKDGV